MIHSLRARLLLTTLAISLIAVAAVGLLSSRVTTIEFERYVAGDEKINLERYRDVLTEHFESANGWNGVQPVLDYISKSAARAMILVGGDSNVITASPERFQKAELKITANDTLQLKLVESDEQGANPDGETELARQEEFVIRGAPRIALRDRAGSEIATLYVVALPEQRAAERQNVFVGSVNRSLLIAAIIAGFVALVAAVILSRRILQPIESLTAAAKKMEGGDLSQKVQVSSRDEIAELAEAFNRMADSLARAEALRRQMVGDIAHELRTPLTNIRCQVEALQDGLSKPDSQALSSLEEEAALLERLIDDLQDLALAEAGRLRLEREAVSLAPEIEQTVSSLQLQATEKKISIKIAVPADLPEAYADPSRVRQILANLLTNAIRYTPPCGEVEVVARAVDSEIEVSVRDTGAGIAPEHLPFVFERFYRTDGARSRSTGGAGLGLAIVKQLITAHGGSARVESTVGKGSSFIFTLPVYRTMPKSPKRA